MQSKYSAKYSIQRVWRVATCDITTLYAIFQNPTMKFNLSINFRESTSKNYKVAIRLAKKFSQFQLATDEDPSNTVSISTTEFASKIKTFETLWNTVKRWNGSFLLLNDDVIDIKKLKEYNKCLTCIEKSDMTLKPDLHCSRLRA